MPDPDVISNAGRGVKAGRMLTEPAPLPGALRAADLPDTDARDACPKCGGTGGWIRAYRDGEGELEDVNGRATVVLGEHLLLRCCLCGYERLARCADARRP